jgi:hypothetical protein
MVAPIAPPLAPAEAAVARLREQGYAVLARQSVADLCAMHADALDVLAPAWDRLAADTYLRDGGRYRHRRHACFVLEGDDVDAAPHRAHWQSLDYNALHGGMRRWFEPIEPSVAGAAAFIGLVRAFGHAFSCVRPATRWYVEAHQFRIDTAGGLGRPTPEGAHRDGVDFVAVLLLARANIKGGETRVFEADGPSGVRFTLEEPWSALLLDDARVIHESTPIQPADPRREGHRDTLVLTYRAGAFQGED